MKKNIKILLIVLLIGLLGCNNEEPIKKITKPINKKSSVVDVVDIDPKPKVILIFGDSKTQDWCIKQVIGFAKTTTQLKRKAKITCESMYQASDLEDGEWNGIKESEYVELIITDDRQQDPIFFEHYRYAHSADSMTVVSNILLKAYQDNTKITGSDIIFPLWKMQDANYIKGLVVDNFFDDLRIQKYKKHLEFINRPNAKLKQFVLDCQKDGFDAIVQYHDAHTLWLLYELDAIGIKAIVVSPPKRKQSDIQIVKKILSAQWIVAE